MSNRPRFMSAAALASVIALGACATTDQGGEHRAENQGTTMTVTQQDGAVVIERKAGPEGGLNIPAQTVVPTVKPEETKDKKKTGSDKTPLKVEPQAGTEAVVISREPGAAGGLRIPAQVVVPETGKKQPEQDSPGVPEP